MCAVKTTIPDNIQEEYYQITPEILQSFPKYRPPIDLFQFKEEIATLTQFSRKGQRLSNELVERAATLCEEGSLFVSRSDHPIYSKHICKQLDLVLVDKNLKEAEVADIFMQALVLRLEAFFEQPVQVVFDQLYADIMVLTEYLSVDPFRVKSLVRRLYRQHSLAKHSTNCGVLGLWLYAKSRGEDIVNRRELDRMALGLFLHDMGMSKIPSFILEKTTPLSQDERTKVNAHVGVGGKMAHKLDLTFDEIARCIGEHHERLDGSGYPRRVGKEELSRAGRLCAVADSFCAMIAKRAYAEAKEPSDAAQELLKDARRYDERLSRFLVVGLTTKEIAISKNLQPGEQVEELEEEDEGAEN